VLDAAPEAADKCDGDVRPHGARHATDEALTGFGAGCNKLLGAVEIKRYLEG